MTTLPLRPLGASGLTTTRIGLGLAALGRPAYITPGRAADYPDDRTPAAMERRCHEMLDAAVAHGVRYVDAARSYGLGESFLASWLQTRQPAADAVTIGSKWGYVYVGDWRLDASTHEVKDLSLQTLRRQAGESRALLGDRLQLYQIHSATLDSGVLTDPLVLDELERLRAGGLVIGLTVTGPAQAQTIRAVLEVNSRRRDLFRVVQATWNLLEPSAGPALAEASGTGMGVIVKEGLANGRLTDRDRNAPPPLAAFAARHDTSSDAVALAAALAMPWADVVLSGAVTVAQLQSNLRAADLAATAGDWPAIADVPDDYWKRRSALAWR